MPNQPLLLKDWVQLNGNRFSWIASMRGSIIGGCSSDVVELARIEYEFLRGMSKKFEESCVIECDSICCFFPTPHNTIPVSRLESLLVRRLIPSKKFHDYYTFIPASKLGRETRNALNPSEYFYNIGGVDMVCMLNTSCRAPPENRLKSKPMLFRSEKPLWADEESAACVFLRPDGKCSIHSSVHLKVCREFACAALFAAKVMEWLSVHPGLKDLDKLNKSYDVLNEVVRKEKFMKKEADYDNKFRELVLDALKGRKVDVSRFMKYRDSYQREVKEKFVKALKARGII